MLFDNNVSRLDQRLHGTRILLAVENCAAHPRDIEGIQNAESLFPTYHGMKKIQPSDTRITRTSQMFPTQKNSFGGVK